MTTPWPAAGQPFIRNVHPAYTSVNARMTLDSPPQPPSTVTQTAASKIQWPQAVRDYVSRAFMATNTISGISNQEVSSKLKAVITTAAENNTMDTIDWYKCPLPQEIIRAERDKSHFNEDSVHSDNSVSSKKRKSSDTGITTGAPVPPWRQRAGLADRMDFVKEDDRKEKKQKKIQEIRSNAGISKSQDLEKRRNRFESSLAPSPYASNFRDDDDVLVATSGPVIGTNQSLEKAYFRLTAPPKPETVRPLEVLKKSIDLVITKWKSQHNYTYVCDQFKSIRQDLTVQHIKNEFTVRVYEAHARIALEKGDLDKAHGAVKHALEVRSALAKGNYHKFFKLYEDSPNMGGYLMDMFVDRERLAALAIITKAYKPDVKVSFLTSELAFPDDQQCAQFLCEQGGEAFLEDREDGPRFLSGKATAVFEAARQTAFAVVDIKGQI
ncbi:hypothetical protein CAC42_6456 [Sphaceloma murrayae]|uniref:SAC3/GANP/THP3 conserved domain-containing protein n=1 Tax=Sphaceloma murrayae TaxID=2082308 RepID=A0A2K1QN51_9PEZI|nr:hypothetical protein CAC42_6456 [Sphaceloma murrayae]